MRYVANDQPKPAVAPLAPGELLGSHPPERYGLKAETKLQSKQTFMKDMKSCFSGMKADQRDALLAELYELAKVKDFIDCSMAPGVRTTTRNDKLRYRQYRLWLAKVDDKLSKVMGAMQEALDVANGCPRQDTQDELHKLVVGKTFKALVRAGNELGKAMTIVRRTQYALAAEVHPKLRTRAEKKLVLTRQKSAGPKHPPLFRKRTRKIDLWFINRAASTLDKYRTKDGKRIPRPGQIIAAVFKSALGETRSEESIRRNLSPSRRKEIHLS